MKNFFISLLYFAVIIMTLVVHVGVLYLLPHPFDKVNLIFVFLVMALMLLDSGIVVWFSALLHFFVELYALTPFGVVLFSGTMAMLLVFWFYKSIFTNRTVAAAAALSALALGMYRLCYSLILALTTSGGGSLSWLMLRTYGWELVTTVFVSTTLYLVIARFSSRLNVTRARI